MLLPIISGTIRNTVKLAELDNKWQQKKKSGFLKQNMDAETRQIMQYKEDLEKMRESNQMAAIDAKLKSGKRLTQEEIDYLKKNNPTAYQNYLEVQQEKESYKRKLKSCKTKDDVDELKVTELGNMAAQSKKIANNPCIPEGQKLQLIGNILQKAAALQEVHMKFVESGAYSSLPTEEELAESKKAENEERREQAESVAENVADNSVQEEAADDSVSEEVTGDSVSEQATDSHVPKEAVDKDVEALLRDSMAKAADALKEPVKKASEDIKAAEQKPVDFDSLKNMLSDEMRRLRRKGYQ